VLLSHNHLVCLQEEARRHRIVEFPYDTHRSAPLVGAVPGSPEEDVGLRDAVDLVELADKEEDPAPATFMFDVAPTGLRRCRCGALGLPVKELLREMGGESVINKIKVGDVVARASYDKDVFFKVVDIIEKESCCTLKGLNIRVIADAPIDDLILPASSEVREYKKDYIKKATNPWSGYFIAGNWKNSDAFPEIAWRKVMVFLTFQGWFFI